MGDLPEMNMSTEVLLLRTSGSHMGHTWVRLPAPRDVNIMGIQLPMTKNPHLGDEE